MGKYGKNIRAMLKYLKAHPRASQSQGVLVANFRRNQSRCELLLHLEVRNSWQKKISREVYPAFKCANESKRRKKRQQECKINNWDASREIYQIISTGKMVSLSPIEIPWTSFRVMEALMNSKCIPVLVLVQLQVNFLLPFALGEEFWTFMSQVKIFSLSNTILLIINLIDHLDLKSILKYLAYYIRSWKAH